MTGSLPIGFPPLDVSLARIQQAIDAAEDAGIPVVMVRQIAPATSPIFAAGSDGAELHTSVVGRKYDLLLEKTLPSCFAATGLDDWLRGHGIDIVAIAGYMTQNCDESTARDAAHRGYAMEFHSDATGTLAMANDAGAVSARALHQAVCVVLQSRFAAVVSTDEWCDALVHGSVLTGSNIYASTIPARQKS